jgi:drug/metabolite transporter (DMT)-like permease
MIFWTLPYVFTKVLLKYFSAFSIAFIRYFIASTVFIILIIVLKIKIPEKRDFKWFFLAGFFGIFLYMIMFNKGCETVSASTSSILISTGPVITALMARVFYKEKIKFFQYAAIIIEFIGVIVITMLHEISSFNIGFLFLILAAIFTSLYNILQRKLTKTYSPLQSTIYSILIGEILFFMFLPGSINEIKNAPPIAFVYITILGVLASATGYFLWSKALSKANKTATVTNYIFVIPLLTSILGFFMINEVPDKATIIGGSIILTGMVIYNFGEMIKDKIIN